MKTFWRSFALLWLPPLAVLLGGLFPLLRTGQVDPGGWALPALFLVPAAVVLTVRREAAAAWWAGLGTLGGVLCCAFLASGRLPALAPALWLVLVALLATLAGVSLAGARWRGGVVLAMVAVTAGWLAKAPSIKPADDRPTLAVISSLPLFWREAATGPAARVDAPIVTVLRQRFVVQPLDSPLSLRAFPTKRLLLAQPRALSAEEMVALDKWVRRGGEVLVLADSRLRWPTDLPLGDRRRPLPGTVLRELLGHWEVDLAPTASSAEERHFFEDGQLVTFLTRSPIHAVGPACETRPAGLVARCRIGNGAATIIGDADLLDDRLWLADPTSPLDIGQWSADTPHFIARALGAAMPTPASWVRSGTTLILAVRAALLAGVFWAMLGAGLFFSRARAPSDLPMARQKLVRCRKRD